MANVWDGGERGEQLTPDNLGPRWSGTTADGTPVIVRELTIGPLAVRRLRRERGVLLGLRSRHVSPWADVVVDQTRGLITFVAPASTAPSLAEELTSGTPFDAATAARIGADLALGLVAVHAAGLVHAGVAPDQVHRDGEPPRGGGPDAARLAGVGVVTAGLETDLPAAAGDVAAVATLVAQLLGGDPRWGVDPPDDVDGELWSLLLDLAGSEPRTARDAAGRLAAAATRLAAPIRIAPVAPLPVAPPVVDTGPAGDASSQDDAVTEVFEPIEPAGTDEVVGDFAEAPTYDETETVAPVPSEEPAPPVFHEESPDWLRELIISDSAPADSAPVDSAPMDGDWPPVAAADLEPVAPAAPSPSATPTPTSTRTATPTPTSTRTPRPQEHQRPSGRRLVLLSVVTLVAIAAVIVGVLLATHKSTSTTAALAPVPGTTAAATASAAATGQATPGPVTSSQDLSVPSVSTDGGTVPTPPPYVLQASDVSATHAKPLTGLTGLDFNSLLRAVYAYCDYYSPPAPTRLQHSFVGYSSGVGINIYDDVATWSGTGAADLVAGVRQSLSSCSVLSATSPNGQVLGSYRISSAGPLQGLPAGQVGLLYKRLDQSEPDVQAVFLQQGDRVAVVLAQGREEQTLGGPLDRAALKAYARLQAHP